MEGKNCFKAQPVGVNKVNNIMKDMTQPAGLSSKTNHGSLKKTLVQKPQDSGVPLNQWIIQITGHKKLQSVSNYSSLLGKQSRYQRCTDRKQTEYRIASPCATSSTLDVNSFKENRLQTMFYGNTYIEL